ncbi:MAG: response regulator [Thermoplasmata archaeon]|nr:response regulator [Thermoplasmata archaeon]
MAPIGKRILVVDDDETVGTLYRQALQTQGFVVESALNGQQALERIEACRPDLILLDIMMPVMDGWEVLERLRHTPDPPLVVVASASFDRARAMEAGAAACFVKPFSLIELRHCCGRLLGVP